MRVTAGCVALAVVAAALGPVQATIKILELERKIDAELTAGSTVQTVSSKLLSRGANSIPDQIDGSLGPEFFFFNEQKLDHFSSTIEAVPEWSHRILFDGQFCKTAGCPVFLTMTYGGGLGKPSPLYVYYAMAKKYGGAVLSVEHRFFGASQPTEDMSVSNLRFLSSRQHMADVANLVRTFKKLAEDGAKVTPGNMMSPSLKFDFGLLKDSRWGAVGCSYPGNLVSWLRKQYPNLIDGAVACGAPVEAHPNFVEYAQVVGSALKNEMLGGSQACYDAVQASVSALGKVMDENPTSEDLVGLVPKGLEPCTPLNSTQNRGMFQSEVFGFFQGLVQYNNIALGAPAKNVRKVCAAATDPALATKGPMASLEAAVQLMQNGPDANTTCVQYWTWEYLTQEVDGKEATYNTTCVDDTDCPLYRQWLWLTCTEFGYIQVTTGDNHPFTGFKLANWELWGRDRCNAAYGSTEQDLEVFRQHTAETNMMFGSRDPGSSHVTFSNGAADPWHALSIIPEGSDFYNSCGPSDQTRRCIKQDLGTDLEAILIPNTAHCQAYYVQGPLTDDDGFFDKSFAARAVDKIELNLAKYLGLTPKGPLLGTGAAPPANGDTGTPPANGGSPKGEESAPEEEDSLSTGAAVAIGAGAVLGLGLVAAAAFMALRPSKPSRSPTTAGPVTHKVDGQPLPEI